MGNAQAIEILRSTGMDCGRWLSLGAYEKDQYATAYWGKAYRLKLNAMGSLQAVRSVDQLCSAALSQYRQYAQRQYRSAQAAMPPVDETFNVTDADYQAAFGTATENASPDYTKLLTTVLQAAPGVINNTISQLSATDRVRLNNENEQALARIHAQYGLTSDPAQQHALLAQQDSLLQLQSAFGSQQGISTKTILLGVGGLVVLGAIVYAISKQN
jgi:hypothetical protein